MARFKLSVRSVALVAIAALAVSAVVAGCGDDDSSGTSETSQTAASGKSRDVSLILEFPPNASQVWFFSGLERGTFDDAGLNVDFIVPDDAATPVKAVTSNRADFGLSLSTDSVTAYGAGAPIKVISTLEPRILEGIGVRGDETPEFSDLAGGTVGLLPLTYEEACFDRLLDANGMTRSDLSVIDPGFNLVPPLVAGKLDGVVASTNYEGVIANQAGAEDFKVFQFSDVCPSTQIHIMTSDKLIADDPELVQDFQTAVYESLAWSMDNPDEAAGMLADRFPDLDAKTDLAQWKATVPTFCAEFSEENGLGYNDPEQWQGLVDLTADQGAIDESFPQEELVTNEYLPDPPMTEPCADERYKEAQP